MGPEWSSGSVLRNASFLTGFCCYPVQQTVFPTRFLFLFSASVVLGSSFSIMKCSTGGGNYPYRQSTLETTHTQRGECFSGGDGTGLVTDW